MAIYFDDVFLQELRDRNDIVDVIGLDVNLKQSGDKFLGLCPFHREKTPSFFVSSKNQLYYCFGCHQGGNIINYVEKTKNLDFVEAVKYLAERVHMDIPESTGVSSKNLELKRKIYEINKKAARYFYENLNAEKGKIALSYLRNRGLDNKTINTYGLGYAPSGWDNLYTFLINDGYKEEELISAGLIVKKEKGCFDFFRDRVIFPVIDLRGNVIAFGGRVFGDAMPKYLNTGETLAFRKRENLFSLHIAKNSNKDFFVLCEGYMDVISLFQFGFTSAIASLGTAFCEEHAKLIKKYKKNVLLCYDSDEAGQNALHKAAKILLSEDVNVKIVTLKGGKDPDEILKKYGTEYFENLLKISKPYVEFVLDNKRQEADLSTIEGKISYAKVAASNLTVIKDDLERELYIRKLSTELEISDDLIRNEYNNQVYALNRNVKRKENQQRTYVKVKDVSTKQTILKTIETLEAELLNLVLSYSEKLDFIRDKLAEDYFITALYKKIYQIIIDIKEKNNIFETNMIIDRLENDEKNEFIKVIIKDITYDDFEVAFKALTERISNEKSRLSLLSSNDSAQSINEELENLRNKYLKK